MRTSVRNHRGFRSPQKLLGPLMLGLGVFYLIFHVVSGEHGLYALLREERKLHVLQSQLTEVETERKALEHKVNLMSDKSLDRDMLDEQARSVLDDASENETVIPLK